MDTMIVSEAVSEEQSADDFVNQLTEMQLALVGGGIGDIVGH